MGNWSEISTEQHYTDHAFRICASIELLNPSQGPYTFPLGYHVVKKILKGVTESCKANTEHRCTVKPANVTPKAANLSSRTATPRPAAGKSVRVHNSNLFIAGLITRSRKAKRSSRPLRLCHLRTKRKVQRLRRRLLKAAMHQSRKSAPT